MGLVSITKRAPVVAAPVEQAVAKPPPQPQPDKSIGARPRVAPTTLPIKK